MIGKKDIPRATPEHREFIVKNRAKGPMWLVENCRPLTYEQIRRVLKQHDAAAKPVEAAAR